MGNAHGADDEHPERHMGARGPAGAPIRMGSIGRAKSERTGTACLPPALHSPHGTRHWAGARSGEGMPGGEHDVAALTPAVPDDAVVRSPRSRGPLHHHGPLGAAP